jgi:hypothetical protein
MSGVLVTIGRAIREAVIGCHAQVQTLDLCALPLAPDYLSCPEVTTLQERPERDGGHDLMLVGASGSDKITLATRLTGIRLPKDSLPSIWF